MAPSDSVADLVSKCRTLAMVCVSVTVARDKALHERETALATAHAEAEALRGEVARLQASLASATKVHHAACVRACLWACCACVCLCARV